MSVLTGVGILLLSMLIMGFLQLVPGVFLLFLHYAFGRFSRKKASDLTLFYIFGIEVATSLMFVIVYYIVSAIFQLGLFPDYSIMMYVIVGIILAIGLSFPFLYFRNKNTTSLFITRKCAEKYNKGARNAKSRSDAFVLGIIATVPELIFTLPLYFVSTVVIMEIGESAISRSAIILLFVATMAAPLLILRTLFYHGYNLGNIQKVRVKNKNFLRFIVMVFYVAIAALILVRI